MPEVIGEGEDEGAEESEQEQLTGSDNGACSSPTKTFLADDRPLETMTKVSASDKRWKVLKEDTSAERLSSCTSSEWLWQELKDCVM